MSSAISPSAPVTYAAKIAQAQKEYEKTRASLSQFANDDGFVAYTTKRVETELQKFRAIDDRKADTFDRRHFVEFVDSQVSAYEDVQKIVATAQATIATIQETHKSVTAFKPTEEQHATFRAHLIGINTKLDTYDKQHKKATEAIEAFKPEVLTTELNNEIAKVQAQAFLLAAAINDALYLKKEALGELNWKDQLPTNPLNPHAYLTAELSRREIAKEPVAASANK